MKNLKRTSYFMIVLIVFQSFSAVANSLDFHSIDTQHPQHDHEHAEHDRRLIEISNNDISDDKNRHHNPADCHHCGHCDGSHVKWVTEHANNYPCNIAFNHNFSYRVAMPDAPINRLLRPPINLA